jgi:hypothetical protein
MKHETDQIILVTIEKMSHVTTVAGCSSDMCVIGIYIVVTK